MRVLLVVLLLVSCLAASAEPSTMPADVQALVGRMKQAQDGIASLQMEGTISRDFDVAGQNITQSIPFHARYSRPNLVLHELKDQARLGSDGKQTYFYVPPLARYHTQLLDEGRLSGEFAENLASQNPLLAMVVMGDPSELLGGYTDLRIEAAQQIGQTRCSVLAGKVRDSSVKFFVDEKTHLLRRVESDVSAELKKDDVPLVNKALIVVDYATVEMVEAWPADTFAWVPPAGAREFSEPDVAQPAGEPTELVGKPAEDFRLKNLEGADVTLSDLKGSVVVLDFWATSCGPCVASMPSLARLHEEFSPRGVKVFAVNLQEDAKRVRQFLKDKALTLPVLFDSDGAVAKKYGVTGIPQTVVIGQDGIITKVIVGFGGDDAPLREAVESALK